MTKKSENSNQETVSSYKIVTDLKTLKRQSSEFYKKDYETEDEYKAILNDAIHKMTDALVDNKAHYCISANAIGLNKKIGIANVTSPIILVNPKIQVNPGSVQIPYIECNISLQNRLFITIRETKITVTADNLLEPLILEYNGILDEKENPELYTNTELMEIVFVQQLIDSMNGILVFERSYVPKHTPIVNTQEKIQRNELVTLVKGDKEMKVKYKRIEKFLVEGWLLQN